MLPLSIDEKRQIRPWVTWVLVLGNCAVFFYQLSLGAKLPKFFSEFAIVPNQIQAGLNPRIRPFFPWDTLLTSTFLHGSLVHLIGNMMPLAVFGGRVEERLGHLRYLLFYLFAGIFASLGFVFSALGSSVPCVGASGAIAGILGASLILLPRSRVLILVPFFFLFRTVRIPAFLFLLLWFLLQIYLVQHPQVGGTQVAFSAHIVGFAYGLLAVFFIGRRRTSRRRR